MFNYKLSSNSYMFYKLLGIVFLMLFMSTVFSASIIQIRRDQDSDWASVNPILAQGELGYSLDLNSFKIGDGLSHWSSLNYFSSGTSGTIWGSITGTLTNQTDLNDALNLKCSIADFNVYWDARQTTNGLIDTNLETYGVFDSDTNSFNQLGDVNALRLFDNGLRVLTSYIDTNAETACGDTEYLRGDGTCQTISSGTPAGSDGQVQYNDSGSFGADANFTWDKTLGLLTISNYSQEDNIPQTNIYSENYNEEYAIDSYSGYSKSGGVFVSKLGSLQAGQFLATGNTDGLPAVLIRQNRATGLGLDVNALKNHFNGSITVDKDLNANKLFQNGNVVCDSSGNCTSTSNDLNKTMSIGNFTDYDLNINYNNIVDTNNIYLNTIWADKNKGYGTMYCLDGNIVTGYLGGYSC